MPRKKTDVEEIEEYLAKIGAIEITEEDRQTDWYKEEMKSIENISCKNETEEL